MGKGVAGVARLQDVVHALLHRGQRLRVAVNIEIPQFQTRKNPLGDLGSVDEDGFLFLSDRRADLILSGGVNIYPAEIECVLLADPRVGDAVVVRRNDVRWGEVPVAFIARRDESLTEADLVTLCRDNLAGYKRLPGGEWKLLSHVNVRKILPSVPPGSNPMMIAESRE